MTSSMATHWHRDQPTVLLPSMEGAYAYAVKDKYCVFFPTPTVCTVEFATLFGHMNFYKVHVVYLCHVCSDGVKTP